MSERGSQASFRLASDRDYRRGVILGLTLAEIMLLLVFLLLLAAGTILTRAQDGAARQAARVNALTSTLGPIMDALSRNGINVEDIDQFSALMRRGQEVDSLRKEVDDMRSALSQLQRDKASILEALERSQADLAKARQELAAAKTEQSRFADSLRKEVDDMRSALSQVQRDKASIREALDGSQADLAKARQELTAAKMEQSRFADSLRKEVDDMRSALSQVQRDKASIHEALDGSQADLAKARQELTAAKMEQSRFAEVTAKAEALERIAKILEGLSPSAGARPEQILANTIGQWREAVERLKRLPGGGKPVCWARPNGDPEAIFIVELRDDGYRVRDHLPRPRPDDLAWAAAERMPRDALIDPKDINSAIAGVVAEGNRRQCRFAVTVRDSTGPANKAQYKKLNYPLYQAFEVKETSQ